MKFLLALAISLTIFTTPLNDVRASVLNQAAQTPTSVTVKPTPASDALVKAAQDLQTEQKSYDTILQQARTGAEANQKSIQADIQKANADFAAELKADKKYAAKLAAIEAMQKKLQAVNQQAEQKFQQDAGPIQGEINKNKALVEGLTPVVRKENDLPNAATFDPATQKWTTPQVPDKATEPKK